MSATVAKPRPIMQERTVGLLGGLFASIGPISMALYTPAMPEIATALGTTDSLVKLSMTVYFGGFAIAQLIAGPLSDALGRRAVTFIFFGIYVVAALLAFAAPTIELLIASRFLQGVGASAGIAIARAVVRDLYQGDRSSRMMNLIGLILSMGSATSPTFGSIILMATDWRALFLFMFVFGLIVMAVAATFLKETVAVNRSPLLIGRQFTSYSVLICNRQFILTALVIACTLGTVYAQNTFLPFVLMDAVGLSPEQFGISMILQSGTFLVGSLVTRYALGKVGAHSLVPLGLVFIAAGSASLLLLHVQEPSFYLVMMPVAVFAFGIAFVMPGVTTAVLAPFPHMAGAAAALLGFVQMGAGLVGGTVGAQLDPTFALATVIPAMGFIACISYILYRRLPHIAEPKSRQGMIGKPLVEQALVKVNDRDSSD